MSAEMVREISTLGISSADALACVVAHVDAFGNMRPTITLSSDRLTAEQKDAVREHLNGIARVMREARPQRRE